MAKGEPKTLGFPRQKSAGRTLYDASSKYSPQGSIAQVLPRATKSCGRSSDEARGDAEEVAAGVAFLASSDASYITGVELGVDGGKGEV
jgi:NAD(P)-dependent dehydrogenase (short-subunit alcohol dehydrogenase family)